MCTPSSLCPEISQLSSRPRVPIPVIFTPDFDPSWILLGEGKGGGDSLYSPPIGKLYLDNSIL